MSIAIKQYRHNNKIQCACVRGRTPTNIIKLIREKDTQKLVWHKQDTAS
jgi:hypothetical protein